MDGVIIRGCQIRVNLARYERNASRNNGVKDQIRSDTRRDIRPFLSQRDVCSYKDVLINRSSKNGATNSKQIWREKKHSKSYEENKIPKTIVVRGEVCKESINYLQRSVIGEGLYHLNPLEVISRLRVDDVKFESVKGVDTFKVLITFQTKEEMIQVLAEKNEVMSQIFDEIRPWSDEETCKVRRVWLSCRGIPLHGWATSNLKKIGEVWGKVVQCEWPMQDLQCAWVQIDTSIFSPINTWIILALDGNVHDVYVREWMGEERQ